jgi:hypothetical protein
MLRDLNSWVINELVIIENNIEDELDLNKFNKDDNWKKINLINDKKSIKSDIILIQ